MKNCKVCKDLKKLNEYTRKPTNKDGYTATCKECTKIREKVRRDKKQEEKDYYRQFEIC